MTAPFVYSILENFTMSILGCPQNSIITSFMPTRLAYGCLLYTSPDDMRVFYAFTETQNAFLDELLANYDLLTDVYKRQVLEGYSATGIEVTDAYAALSKERIERELA